jgi:hypothetical protein
MPKNEAIRFVPVVMAITLKVNPTNMISVPKILK